jgi:hypothetical protein
MFDRAFSRIVAVAAASAAAVMAVFASGFALYALIIPVVGAAGAAAIVALVAALAVALFALTATLRSRQREREAEFARQEVERAMPQGLGGFASEKPLLSLGLSAVAGLVAARYPTLVRDLMAILDRHNRG